MIELMNCIPMNARITQIQCDKNRTRKDNGMIDVLYDHRCTGCAGLVADTTGDDMAKICKVEGCTKTAQQQGKCKAHLNGTEPRKSVFKNRVNVSDIQNAETLPPVRVDVKPVMVSGAEEIRNIDYMAFMRQKFDEKFEEWATELNTARTPYERAQRFLDQCDAIIGLGY
jgi:hypothetical protein